MYWALGAIAALVAAVAVYDLLQRKHAILRNFPVVGHFRYWFEAIGPELRQYIVTSNNEERPFSRDQRRWVYTSAKRENNYFGFGTDNDLDQSPNHLIIKHAQFPLPSPPSAHDDARYPLPCAKTLGEARGRAKAFRPASVLNISGMSFGSLSAAAVEALNRGCKAAGCLHNTGEGGIAAHHDHGGELIWQIGTGYFGCRGADGEFDLGKLKDVVARYPVRAIEIKLSQGAKPGLGGVLPGSKVTPEIAAIRGIPVGKTCSSPARHRAFSDADSLLDFVERVADETGLPVGIKSAVGEMTFWRELARLSCDTGRGVDFIAIDGGEGGTGAAPLAFTDHVALPFKIGFSRVFRQLADAGLAEQIVFIGSGKLGLPDTALLAFALGCDMINVGREALFAVGCIQAQKCHTGHCPTGVATQSKWLMRGLDRRDKAARLANYIVALRKELLRLSRACAVVHPALITGEHFEILDDRYGSRSACEVFGYAADGALPSPADREAIRALMADG